MQKSEENRNTPTSYIYCGADNETNLSDKHSVTSTAPLFNDTIIYWCSKKKQSETPKSSSNAETRALYTVVLDKNWIRNFYRSIGYPIFPP